MKKVNKLLDEIKPIRKEIKKRCLAYKRRDYYKKVNEDLDFEEDLIDGRI